MVDRYLGNAFTGCLFSTSTAAVWRSYWTGSTNLKSIDHLANFVNAQLDILALLGILVEVVYLGLWASLGLMGQQASPDYLDLQEFRVIQVNLDVTEYQAPPGQLVRQALLDQTEHQALMGPLE
ncbi:hypothetical protein TCAL_14490 [Tigriopus californicus]|uniref:Uncharacterized protein n=1 Tax=Tigriopus californicus TaxID=6832 RepID=A0A553PU19_TIGCA|nr:hypothetical protein TCAL_14490 [Tigriopus californicus]